MSTIDSKAIVRRYINEGMIGGDLSAADRAYSPDFRYHNPVAGDMPALPAGPEGVKLLLSATRSAFPDMEYTVDALIAEDDMVSVFYTWNGTHTGELGGIPATGKHVTAMGAMACRIAGDKIVEEWDVDDRLGVIQQLGLMPSPGQPDTTSAGT